MYTISQHTWNIITSDTIALEYLSAGLLNTTAYAKKIQPEIESRTMTPVTINSIVTSLSRIRRDHLNTDTRPRFVIQDIVFKLPISELIFQKKTNPSRQLAALYHSLEGISDVHFNVVNVQNELDIFVSSSQADLIISHLDESDLLHQQHSLSALILKYDPAYREYSGMASQILSALAVNSIVMVECLTTYSEFIIYINQREANRAIDVLNREFMSGN